MPPLSLSPFDTLRTTTPLEYVLPPTVMLSLSKHECAANTVSSFGGPRARTYRIAAMTLPVPGYRIRLIGMKV
jgi:hypothetical protein